MRIREILSAKGHEVVTIRPEASVADLVALLNQHNVGAVVVSPDGHSVTGIATERDVVRRLPSIADLGSAVAELMTAPVHTCGPEDTIDSLARTMTEKRIRHLPVLDDGDLIGIVSIGDVVKSYITQLEFERDQLEDYLSR